MLTVIMGENASGKTLFLRDMYDKEESVVTNLPDTENTFTEFDNAYAFIRVMSTTFTDTYVS